MTLLPTGKRFAFSILDDTDDSTLENVEPLYAILRDHGFRTTKTAPRLKRSAVPAPPAQPVP